MDELIKESDLEGLYLSCSCWYHNQHEYEFTLRLNGISQINTRNFTISGDIMEIDDTGLIQSFRDRIVPKKLLNVILVYNFEDRTMKFEKKMSGLVIKPEDGGERNWSTLLEFVGRYYSAHYIMPH